METTNKDEPEISKLDFNDSDIEYVSYAGEHHLPLIMNLVDQELSEPYSIFTYRYFVYLWPHLSFLVPNFSSFHFFILWVVSHFIVNHFNFDISVVCFRRFIRVDVWVRWFVKWGNIVTLLEDILLCLLLSNPTEEEALLQNLLLGLSR